MTPDEIMTSPTIFTIWPSNACTDSCQRTFSSLRPPINYTEKEIRRTVSFYARQMNRTRSNFCGTQSKGVPVRKWSKDFSTRGIHFSLDYTNCIFALLKGMSSLLKRKFMRVPCASHVEIHAFCTSREANGKVKMPRLLPVNGGLKCMLCVNLNRQYSYSPTVLGRVGLDHECEAHAGTFSPTGQTNMKKLRLSLPNLSNIFNIVKFRRAYILKRSLFQTTKGRSAHY